MKSKDSKTNMVLKVLRRKSMSPIEIINMGILNPYSVIQRLRGYGHSIEMRKSDGEIMCRYYLKK